MLFFSVMQVFENLSRKLCANYHVVARTVKQFDQELVIVKRNTRTCT